ncbi:multidrug ABC transporter permease [Pilimelia anulata]|uniref:Multidrug ABC transporter permease n=1 Tax=Pilimelia anulata TaxID=53371 RepID=A0A8J3B6Q3_9ACTN|nr:ABC transporter ATP-binding protein [Pilimelia anulata]GGJ75469.1 multidrug ABC transporter permease [Pilimelia anulata]
MSIGWLNPKLPTASDSQSVLPELGEASWLGHTDVLVGTSFLSVARRLPAIVRRALRVAWAANRRDTLAALVLNLVGGMATAVGLLATQSVLTQLFAQGPTLHRVRAAVPALALVAVTVAIRSGLSIAAGWAQSRLEPQVVNAIERRMFATTTAVDLAAFDDAGFVEEMQRVRQRGGLSAQWLVRATIDLASGAAGLIGTATALCFVHPLLLLALVIATIPGAWTAVRSGRCGYLVERLFSDRRRRMWMLAEVMADRDAAAEVRAYTARDFLLRQYDAVADAQTASDIDVANVRSRIRLVGGVAGGAATAGVYGLLGLLLADAIIPLAAAGTAVLALQAARQSLALALVNVNRIYEESLYFSDFLDFSARANSLTTARDGTAAIAAPQEIDVRNVSLQYPGSDRLALEKVSITVSRGQTIALVGENGSGKTTLAKVLAGLYQPTAGVVHWNQQPIPAGGQHLWQHVALVPQDHMRWPFSVHTNITIGTDHTDARGSDAAIQAAARTGGAHAMIENLPRGYDTLLSRAFAAGVDLSGGQWQRIACTRAFYRDAPLLICDEPSAALDARAEHKLFTALREHAANRITVLVTHRLANVRHADHIYVLHEGQLVEQGNHHHLMAATGLYKDLFTLQAAGYADAKTATPTPTVPAQGGTRLPAEAS